uniref:Secreted protein n=1 Tax=Knipowitschia caucasica TaxID=637954 RepID=A0AAV2LEK5_KNICA
MVVFIIPQQLWWVGLPWLKAQCTFCSPHTFSLLAVTELGSSSWYEDLRLCSATPARPTTPHCRPGPRGILSKACTPKFLEHSLFPLILTQ